jgi:hypothetical protein
MPPPWVCLSLFSPETSRTPPSLPCKSNPRTLSSRLSRHQPEKWKSLFSSWLFYGIQYHRAILPSGFGYGITLLAPIPPSDFSCVPLAEHVRIIPNFRGQPLGSVPPVHKQGISRPAVAPFYDSYFIRARIPFDAQRVLALSKVRFLESNRKRVAPNLPTVPPISTLPLMKLKAEFFRRDFQRGQVFDVQFYCRDVRNCSSPLSCRMP